MASVVETSKPGASAEVIRTYYDRSPEFFRLFLGDPIVYSGAFWDDDDPSDTLEQAQARKIDFHMRCARATGVGRLLDIGCGWGTLLRRAVATHGVQHATGLTLSPIQKRWIDSFGESRIDIRLDHWWDHRPAEPYDAIITIEALEHFAQEGYSEELRLESYRHFFARCHQWLKPGGFLSLQDLCWGIAHRGLHPRVAEMWLETDMPRLAELVRASEMLFEVVSVQQNREHYARTCRVWLERLRGARAEAVALAGEDATQHFEDNLELWARGFELGSVEIPRVVFRRSDKPVSTFLAQRQIARTWPPAAV
jgi:cyclopropane-fatty-acyl-phospholipid synthase